MPDISPRIIQLQETGSTNSDAMRLALAGEPLPLWVVADRQTAGRGRAGRAWVSKSGNLHASYAFACEPPLRVAGELSLVAGVALIDAIRESCRPQARSGARLKWPNDALIGGAKAGGILVESTTQIGSPGFVAILGFGVNVIEAPDEFGRAATTLSQHGTQPSRDDLLAVLADHVDHRIREWDGGRGFSAIRQAWLERAGPEGEAITVNTADGRLSGNYRGLAPSGAMLAEISGTVREIGYGDVALGAAAEAEAS